ncbi:hypothetical protein Tco_1362385 [Tanacetum coccineum]
MALSFIQKTDKGQITKFPEYYYLHGFPLSAAKPTKIGSSPLLMKAGFRCNARRAVIPVQNPEGLDNLVDPTLCKLMTQKVPQISSIGRAQLFFLGLKGKQEKRMVFISQDKYVGEILKKFGFSSVRTANTPMETNKVLTKDEDGEDVDVHLYNSMIGSLMYLTSSRPDIMFSVCACSRFQVQLKVSHLNAAKRIFRYLKGRPNLGLWYPKDSPFILEAFSDSDYVGASLDRKSINRRDSYEKRLIEMVKINTDNNVADLLTKAFDFLTFIHGLCIDMDPHEFSLVYLVGYSGLCQNRGKCIAIVTDENKFHTTLEADGLSFQEGGDSVERGIDSGGQSRRQETMGGIMLRIGVAWMKESRGCSCCGDPQTYEMNQRLESYASKQERGLQLKMIKPILCRSWEDCWEFEVTSTVLKFYYAGSRLITATED